MNGQLKIFTGNANPELARQIAKYLKTPLGDALVATFSEGEIRVKVNEDVRGRDVFIIQPTCPPSNNNLITLSNAAIKPPTAIPPALSPAIAARRWVASIKRCGRTAIC